MSTVVVGGGIVGLTAVHYLLREGRKVTLVEKCAIACHSSGKAGGFLTDGDSGWHRGPVARLAKHSFALHARLAAEFGADSIGYRAVKCFGRGTGEQPPGWLKPQFAGDMGDQDKMAQVSPKKLMDALAADVSRAGCEVVIGKAVGVELDGDKVTAVKLLQAGAEKSLPCDSLILSMGCWARDAAEWFPGSSMPRDTVSNRYTSVIWDDVEVGKDATMVFVSDRHHVEIYPRADECYANGCPTDADLPDDPLDIVPPSHEIEDVKAEALSAVPRLKGAKVLRTTACFLAGSDTNLPIVQLVPKVTNAVVACGGGCWGILNGPAMGQAAAALAIGKEPEVDLTPFGLADGASDLPAGVPPKLLGLLAQNPAMAEMLKQDPEGFMQMVRMMSAEEG